MKANRIPQSKVNIKFLSPTILLFIAALIFLLLLPVLPVKVNFPLSISAMIFWIFCLVSFLSGTLIGAGSGLNIRLYNLNSKPKTVKRFVTWVVIFGFLGTVLLVVDRYVIRGASWSADALENREILMESSASKISIIAAMLSSFGILSYLTIWVAELGEVTISRGIKLLAILNVLTAIVINIQLGSRSLLLIVTIIHLLGWFFIFRMRGGRVKSSHIALLVSVVITLAIVSAGMMVSRVELMGFSMLDSISISVYAQMIQPSQFMLEVIQKDETLAMFFSGLFSLLQYIFHGIYEFSFLFTNFHGDHTMGTQIFWLPVKFLSIMPGPKELIQLFDNPSVREGVFNTFVGPVFIDFGLVSPLVLFYYGVFVGVPFRWLRMGRVEWLPTVTLIGANALLWPIVNIFMSASGAYLLTGAILIGLLGKNLRGSPRIIDRKLISSVESTPRN